jgi:hypothetical protein
VRCFLKRGGAIQEKRIIGVDHASPAPSFPRFPQRGRVALCKVRAVVCIARSQAGRAWGLKDQVVHRCDSFGWIESVAVKLDTIAVEDDCVPGMDSGVASFSRFYL